MYNRINSHVFRRLPFNLCYVHRREPSLAECLRWRRFGGGWGMIGKFLSLPALNSREKKGRFIEVPVEWAGGGPIFSGACGPMR